MFPTFKTAQYIDVFAPKTGVDAGLMTFMIVLIFVGFFTILISSLLGDDFVIPVIVLGGIIAIGGIVGVTLQNANDIKARQGILKGMTSNVKEKYHADLDTTYLDDRYYSDLGKIKNYVLTFENGTSGQYSMKFLKSGEPVVVEANEVPTAPSVQELNSGEPDSSKGNPEPTQTTKPVETASPKTAPTPDELEKSSK